MLQIIFVEYIVIFMLSIFFVKIVQNNASFLKLLDKPNARTMHQNSKPTGAGIGFLGAVGIVFPLFHMQLFVSHIWLYSAIFIVFLVGIWDDMHETTPRHKFIIIAIATVLIYIDGIVINDVGVFFGFHLYLGWFALPFTLFAVMGFTNALNLIDGIDGLSGTLSMIIFASFVYIGFLYHDTLLIVIGLSLIVALLGFMVFNWHPATIFMGDSGSLTLGFIISVLSIQSLAYVPAIAILFVAAIPILDTIYVIIRRKRNGHSSFAPDKCHIHHLLNIVFHGNIRKTVLVLASIQAIYSFIGIHLSKWIDAGWLLLVYMVNIVCIYLFLRWVIRTKDSACEDNIR